MARAPAPKKDEAPAKPAADVKPPPPTKEDPGQPSQQGAGEGMAALAAAEAAAQANRPSAETTAAEARALANRRLEGEGMDQDGPAEGEASLNPAFATTPSDPREAIEANRNAHVAEVGRLVLQELPEGSQASAEPGGDRPILRLWVPTAPNGRQDCTIGLGPAGLDPEGDARRALGAAREFFGLQG